MPAQPPEELARNARFVFHGTVQNVSPRAVPGVAGAKALSIRVDEIVQVATRTSTVRATLTDLARQFGC